MWVFLLLMVFSIMLTPSLRLVDSAPKIRFEELLMLPLFGYLVLIALSNGRIEYAWGLRQTLFSFFPIFFFVSMATGMWLGYDASLGDFNQLIRIIKYIVIYTLAVTVIACSTDPERIRTRVLQFILALSTILFAIALQQYLDLFNLNRFYIDSIADAGAWRLRDATYRPRPIGMVGNANELGFQFAVAALAGLYLCLREFRMWYVVALVMSLVGVILAGSRSSIVAAATGIAVIAFAMVFQRRGSKRPLRRFAALALSLLVVGTGILAWADTGRLFYRFEGLLEPSEDMSWVRRMERWDENTEGFKQSPLFGLGPLRKTQDELLAADSEWLLLLRSYGLVGTTFLVVTMLAPLLVRRPRDDASFLTLGIFASAALYMIPAAVFHSLALMPLVLVLVALSDTTVRRRAL